MIITVLHIYSGQAVQSRHPTYQHSCRTCNNFEGTNPSAIKQSKADRCVLCGMHGRGMSDDLKNGGRVGLLFLILASGENIFISLFGCLNCTETWRALPILWLCLFSRNPLPTSCPARESIVGTAVHIPTALSFILLISNAAMQLYSSVLVVIHQKS